MNNWFNKNGIHLAIIAIFVVITFAYFSPVLQGKAPAQSDVLQSQAMQKEIMDFKEKDGKGPLWTNQMFGGMPAYQIWVQYAYNGATYGIAIITKALPNPVGTVLLLLFGSYFLFIVLRINPWLAAAGAIAFTFTTYNFVLIASGHSSKALAIGFFAPIIAGIILTLRGRYWYGASLTALFLALEIRTNHVQMTYYLFLAILVFVLVEIYQAYKTKTLSALGKAFGFLALSIVIAVMINASLLWSTAEYAKETNRGKSNLTSTATAKDAGMSKEYAYQWSQGVGESFTFLIPDLYGGATSSEVLVKPESNMYKAVSEITGGDENQTKQAILSLGQQLNMQQYWGEKPFTQGGYYFGAIICFLFVFGLFIVRSPLKWWILFTTILFILLSYGKNFPYISDIFFNYFPLYNKFRAVESILAVVGLMVPVLALLALKEAQEGNIDQKVLVKKLTWSAGLTGGFALLVGIAPTLFFSFKASNHLEIVQALTQSLQNNASIAQKIANALVDDRISIARTDAFRSFFFILAGFGIVWAFITKKMNMQFAFGLLALAVLVDMWQIDKRYLNNNNFESKSSLETYFQPRDVDNFILADKDPNFRVYDQSVNTFNTASTSAFHKTIGGYHAAKLKRYDELIQNQFAKSINHDVLDMLNTKYIISQDPQNGSYKMERNASAAGNAWFVPSVQFAKNADEEMKAISSFDPKKEAIVDESYKGLIDTKRLGSGQEGFIKLTNYNPDHLTYEYSSAKDVVAVFSEIYYDKGWKMFIDGVEKPYFRADYVLRAAQLEAGNHKLEFIFHPASYYTGEQISLAGTVLLLAGLAFGIYLENKKKKAVKA
ncbi:YfhO family protein [Pedobacter punctiformis]|uniref:YfhO family protein n=1 Tax=Pedobacter punctiformis TaxID=3004097 RepID=A0ABT4L4V0_9SPHI|nr:YfhO family protein [Pedobacter sp. HCMS5-2]MCZ4242940.1 YfhO family protein [Pedobacter sp. HCMS5-2]